jgi:hypothetical protein
MAAILGRLLTTRGQIIRRGASGPEALAAKTADTFVGGDGTDVTIRTASQVRTSINVFNSQYNPTGTTVANLDAVTMFGGTNYFRLGSLVLVFGLFNADATAGGGTSTQLGISLPVASNFIGSANCTGVVTNSTNEMVGTIVADFTNDRAEATWLSQSTSNVRFSYIFGYIII